MATRISLAGFHLVADGKIYFGSGTFKSLNKQILKNPQVEVLAVNGNEFLRYDGTAKTREAIPQIMAIYDKNGWEMGLFYLEIGHAKIRGMMDQKDEFDL